MLFGDGYFGKKLENGKLISVSYIVTDGEAGNGYAVEIVGSERIAGKRPALLLWKEIN